MKKEYETPKVELMTFDYKESVVASGTNSGRTDLPNTYAVAWTCNTRYVDVKNTEGTVCGYVPQELL